MPVPHPSTRGRGAARALLLLVMAALATTVLPPPAAAQPRSEQARLDASIQIRTKKTAAVVIGDTAWVAVSLRAKVDVDDLRFTATLDGGAVGYPANTVDHSGPYNGYRLDRRETDYVAFQVTVPDGFDARAGELRLDASWTEDGSLRRGSETVRIPLVVFEGLPYTLVSDTVTLPEEADGWVELGFAGLAPRLESFEVAVIDPDGLDVYYPLGSYTSLAGDSLLEDGETDVARFRLGESHQGSPLPMVVEVRYRHQGAPGVATHALTVVPG